MVSKRDRPDPISVDGDRPLLVAMLPARNAAADLPEYLAHLSTFCDGLVALDDGSTDDTHAILDAHPLVRELLRNPRREDYRGWDDAANRNRLLTAATRLSPDWLLSLDADERLDPRDAASLRDFLFTDALPGHAYGLRHVPMRRDANHFIPRYQWAYRLFSAGPGQRFPSQKLHFVPVPTAIPRQRWLKTTLRIQHFGELTAARRMGRFGKYLEADTTRTYQTDYAQYLAAPITDEVRRWQPRPESMPVLLDGVARDIQREWAAGDDPDVPMVSAIIVDRDGAEGLMRTVVSVASQAAPGDIEIIVLTRDARAVSLLLRAVAPAVTPMAVPASASLDEARNIGLAAARGRWAIFPSTTTELLPSNLVRRVDAHRRGYAMVTGTCINGMTTPVGWAAYLLAHTNDLPGLPPGQTEGPLVQCSYGRLPLVEVGGFPENETGSLGAERATDDLIFSRGYVAFRDDGARHIEHSSCATLMQLLWREFQVGRSWGARLVARHRHRGRLFGDHGFWRVTAEPVQLRLARLDANAAIAERDVQIAYRQYRHLIALGAVAAWIGTWFELLRPGPGKSAILWGRPVRQVFIAGPDHYALAQIDAVSGEVVVRPLPRDLELPIGTRLVPLDEAISRTELRHAGAARETMRKMLEVALDVEPLDCVIDLRLSMPTGPSANRSASQRQHVLRDGHRLIHIAVAMRRGRMWSTLGWRATARLLRHLSSAGQPAPTT